MIRAGGVIRRARNRFAEDRGISLIEMVVTMMLGILVTSMVVALFISTSKSISVAQNEHQSANAASNAANELNRVIRFGTPNPRATVNVPDPAFIAAGREVLTVFSDIDVNASVIPTGTYPRPQIVQFAVNSSRQLIETRWTATASGEFWTFPSYPATPASNRNLGGVFATTASGDPLFVYLDAGGVPVPTPATGSMSADLMKTVASVRITVIMRAESNPRSPFVTVVNTITMPNLGVAGVVS